MAITAKSVYRDTGNFFRNQFASIFLLSLLCALITAVLLYVFSPSAAELAEMTKFMTNANGDSLSITEWAGSLPVSQQRMLLKVISAYTFSLLISNTLMTGGLLTLVKRVSAGQQVSALSAFGSSAPSLPRLFILLFLVTLFIDMGFYFFVLPGVFLAVVLAMAPVIMMQDQAGIIYSLRRSVSLALANMWLITPVVIIWFLLKIVFQALMISQGMTGNIINAMISNLVTAGLLIYLFRLYSLIR